MTQLPPYLTPRQVATALTEAGVTITEDAARRWAREGMIDAIRLPGGQYRIPREAVEAILTNKTAVPAGAA